MVESSGHEAPDRLSDAERSLVEAEMAQVEVCLRRVKRRLGSAVEDDELLAAGHVGLIEAARRFNAKLGVPFGAFAHHRIAGAMIDLARRRMREGKERAAAARAACLFLEQAQNHHDVMRHDEGHALSQVRDHASGLLTAMFVATVAEASHSTEEDLAKRQSYARAQSALHEAKARLDAEGRALVEEIYERSTPLERVAEKLGVSYSTLYRRHRRLLSQLRHELLREGVEESPGSAPNPT